MSPGLGPGETEARVKSRLTMFANDRPDDAPREVEVLIVTDRLDDEPRGWIACDNPMEITR